MRQRICETTRLPAATAQRPGRVLLRLLAAGDGTTAIIPPAVLQTAARSRVFPKGEHVYWDEATTARVGPNGERSVLDLAAVLAEDARWDAATESLIVEAIPMRKFADAIRELRPHIGIQVTGIATATAPATRGGRPTITRIAAGASIAFVADRDAPGAVAGVLEAAGRLPAANQPPPAPQRRNAFGRPAEPAPPAPPKPARRTAFGRPIKPEGTQE